MVASLPHYLEQIPQGQSLDTETTRSSHLEVLSCKLSRTDVTLTERRGHLKNKNSTQNPKGITLKDLRKTSLSGGKNNNQQLYRLGMGVLSTESMDGEATPTNGCQGNLVV